MFKFLERYADRKIEKLIDHNKFRSLYQATYQFRRGHLDTFYIAHDNDLSYRRKEAQRSLSRARWRVLFRLAPCRTVMLRAVHDAYEDNPQYLGSQDDLARDLEIAFEADAVEPGPERLR